MESNDVNERTSNSLLHTAADGRDCAPCGTCPRSVQFLCYFMHRLLDFRHAEIESIASLNGSNSSTESNGVSFDEPCGGSYLSPFWYVWLPSEDSAKTVAKRSVLVKSFLEVWGEGATWEELLASIQAYPRERIQRWCMPNISFKILVDGWGRAVKQEQQLDIINKFDFLGLQGPIKLQAPDLTLRVIIADPADNNGLPEVPYRIYFGRDVACSDRSVIHKYGLPRRKYLGPTSMDTEMAFLMCNQGQVKKGDIVYDPFVGTGSILVAASHYGAHTFGADIDIRIVRDGKVNKAGKRTDIWDNFRDYNLMSPVGLIRADAHRPPFRANLQDMFDAIICDPPYGVRAGGKKSVAKSHKITCAETHIPSTDAYTFEECLRDLLHLAAKHLKLGGRLVFFLPSVPGVDKAEQTAAHPMLAMVANCEQPLTTRYSRRLITLQKVQPYNAELEQQALLSEQSFRPPMKSIHEVVYESHSKAQESGGALHLQRYRGKLV